MFWWIWVAAAQVPPPSPAVPASQAPSELARLAGTVLEHGSGLPLAGALVTVGAQTVLTDERGQFTLLLPAGEAVLQIVAEDHKEGTFTEQLSGAEQLEVKYRLERYTWTEEIVVYGEAREEIARQVISVEELRRVPGSFGDPIRALQSLPSVARGPELSGDIVARGAEARNTAAYIDGIRIPFVFHFLVGRSVVDPGQLEDIEFYPGAVPPEYGDVSQAVINARTRFDRAEPGLHGRVHVDLLEAGVSAAANLGDHWTLRVGGRRAWVASLINGGIWVYRGVQGLNEPGYRPASLRVPYRDLQLRLVGTHGPDRTSFTLLSARDGIELVPERLDTDGDGRADPPPPSDLPYDPNLMLDSRFVRVQMRWDRELAGHRYSTWMTIGQDKQQNLIPGLGLVGATGLQFARLHQGWYSVGHRQNHTLSDAFELGTGADVVYQPGSLTAVYELEDELGEYNPEAVTSAERVWAGPYAELAWTPGEWRITPGLRVSLHHLLEAQVVPEPRLGVRRALGERWSIVGYTGLLSQGPTLETAGTGFARGELGVVRAWQSTVGVEASWPSGWGLDVAVFETEMYDLTVRDTRLVVEPTLTVTSTGGEVPEIATVQEVPYYRAVHGRAFGLEAQLRIMPRGEQFGWIAGSVGRSLRYPEHGQPFRSLADLPFNLVAVWGTGLGKGWTLSGRGQLGSGLVFTPLIGSYDVIGDRWESYTGRTNAERYPLYKRFDVRVDKTWTGQRARWTLYLDVYNTINHKNPLFATYDWPYETLVTEAFVPILPALGLEVAY
jgi:hypothetical protein